MHLVSTDSDNPSVWSGCFLPWMGVTCRGPAASFSGCRHLTPLVWGLGPLVEVDVPGPWMVKSCSVGKFPRPKQVAVNPAWERRQGLLSFHLLCFHFPRGGGSWTHFYEEVLPISETEVKDAKWEHDLGLGEPALRLYRTCPTASKGGECCDLGLFAELPRFIARGHPSLLFHVSAAINWHPAINQGEEGFDLQYISDHPQSYKVY